MKLPTEGHVWIAAFVLSVPLAVWATPEPKLRERADLFMPPGPTTVEPPGMMCCRGAPAPFRGVTIVAQHCPPEPGDWYGVTGKARDVLRLVLWAMRTGHIPEFAVPLDDDRNGRMELRDIAAMW